ncbi:hypothetical protein DFH09DRAFT_1306052 [Mycena vulgaris]|nr:hypothetical protein DFH09DRAFT_1306052 [Mycena vulgaris]
MPTPTPSCSGRCHAAASAVTAVATTEPWGGFGGDDGQMLRGRINVEAGGWDVFGSCQEAAGQILGGKGFY